MPYQAAAQNVQAPMEEELQRLDAYWRTANYLAVGMIYLQDNPLLREPLQPDHIKNRLLGHWGSSPGQAFRHARLMGMPSPDLGLRTSATR